MTPRKTRYFKISIVIPTLNSQRTLKQCLFSIVRQDYRGRKEIVIADGGSTDKTIEIAKAFAARIVKNELKTGEAGKAVGAKHASGELVAFIDSDNTLPSRDWFSKMTQPFLENKDLVAAEPLYFTYRRKDHWLTRYFSLLGMGDPLNLFIGNYDRYSFVSDKWTGMRLKYTDEGNYLLLYLKENLPTIGANGFILKRNALNQYPIKEYLFDIDVLRFLALDKPVKVAKVKIGIVHLFTGDISTFVRKQRRRISDFLYFYKLGVRAREFEYWRILEGIVKFIIATVTVVPLFVQMIAGLARKRDPAWLFHIPACWLTLLAYGFESIRSVFVTRPFDRKKWSQ